MNKPDTIEGVYCGLLESVRRVENFPKPENEDKKELSVKGIVDMIDYNISELQVQANALTVYDDDIISGEIYGSLETLEGLRKNITDKINKGE